MTDSRLSRLQDLDRQITSLGTEPHRSERQERFLRALQAERDRLIDAIELDKHQQPLFPDAA